MAARCEGCCHCVGTHGHRSVHSFGGTSRGTINVCTESLEPTVRLCSVLHLWVPLTVVLSVAYRKHEICEHFQCPLVTSRSLHISKMSQARKKDFSYCLLRKSTAISTVNASLLSNSSLSGELQPNLCWMQLQLYMDFFPCFAPISAVSYFSLRMLPFIRVTYSIILDRMYYMPHKGILSTVDPNAVISVRKAHLSWE